MTCTQCGTLNDAGRKFCLECGARLAIGCPNCGAANPDGAKFCGECGTALTAVVSADRSAAAAAAAGAKPTAASAERRLVTVLFADLVGFTTMSQDEDPEDTREFLTRYFDLARTIVERYGGTIEKFIGDAVMAVWGAPTTHEDDAERAVRAAMELVDGVPGISETRAVQARAGVLTGQAAVTLGASGQGMVAGDLVNTASRLQSVAPPGSVLVGEATFHAAQGAVSFEEAGEQVLKGKTAPVPAWRATAIVGLRGGTGRSEALEPPFVGRDEDLRLLKELFHATERERKARLVSVIGQGGIGKSRLAWEFEKYIDGVVEQVWWHRGRSPAYGDGISYWALAEMVRGRAGIAETDDSATAVARLHEALVEWLPDEQERRWVEPRLGALLALEQMPPGSRDELFAAWRTFFERIAERGPTVLVFEDVQWADEGMLDFIIELLDRSRTVPILVLVLTRPELYERHPGWGATLRSLTTMALEPLERPHMTALVGGTVPGIAPDATAAIVERAEGIPLYAVETIRMLLDRGILVRSADGAFQINGRVEDLAVPHTLQALIAARLDSLGERDRRLAQSAAVMGKSFTLESVAALSEEPPDALRDRLASLVQRQVLEVEVDPRSPERGQYQFVQAVVREVAESSLSRADRRSLHLAAARYYESLGDDELAGVQASHYVEAYRATPVGPEADALAAQARVSLRAAAERASSLYSYRQALSYLEQAIAVTTDVQDLAALHERAVNPALHAGLKDVAVSHAQALESIARDRGDAVAAMHAVTLQARVELSHHQDAVAAGLLRSALEHTVGIEGTAELMEAQAELARAFLLGSNYGEALAWSDRALEGSSVASDQGLTNLLITRGTALVDLGRRVEGEVLLRGARQVAERNGDNWAALRALNNTLGVVAADDLAAAATLQAEGYRTAMRFGLMTWAYQFASAGLSTSFDIGDWQMWVDEATALDAPDFYAGWRLLELGVRAAMRGELDEARSLRRQAAEIAGASGQARASLLAAQAVIDFAGGNFAGLAGILKDAWSDPDATTYSVPFLAAAAAATNDATVAAEAAMHARQISGRGRFVDGLRHLADTVLAMVEQRWDDARAEYQAARRDLAGASANFDLAMLQLAVGERGAGIMPEAEEAAAAAREFFSARGASSFVETYQTATVRDSATETRRAASESVPNAAI